MIEPNEPRRFLAEVRQRYLMDAEFHARVEMAVGVVRQGYVLDDEGLIAGIAAVGLAMADVPLGREM